MATRRARSRACWYLPPTAAFARVACWTHALARAGGRQKSRCVYRRKRAPACLSPDQYVEPDSQHVEPDNLVGVIAQDAMRVGSRPK